MTVVILQALRCRRGHLTCTNRRAPADEQKLARNEGFCGAARHAPTLLVFNIGPKWVFPCAKTVLDKIAFFALWKLLRFREREKVAETFRQCTFSLDSSSLFGFWSGCLLRRPPRPRKWPSGYAHLLAHIRRPPNFPFPWKQSIWEAQILAGNRRSSHKSADCHLLAWVCPLECSPSISVSPFLQPQSILVKVHTSLLQTKVLRRYREIACKGCSQQGSEEPNLHVSIRLQGRALRDPVASSLTLTTWLPSGQEPGAHWEISKMITLARRFFFSKIDLACLLARFWFY